MLYVSNALNYIGAVLPCAHEGEPSFIFLFIYITHHSEQCKKKRSKFASERFVLTGMTAFDFCIGQNKSKLPSHCLSFFESSIFQDLTVAEVEAPHVLPK